MQLIAVDKMEGFWFEEWLWTISAEKVKNGFPHRVPLSSLAKEVLSKLNEVTGDSQWLFPSPRDGQHIAETSVDHAVRTNVDHFEIAHFVPHDLRRTAASMMTASGIQRLTVSKILNHVESDVTSVYDRHSYDKEKQKGLRSWGRQLEAILGHKTSSKVIPIRNSKMTWPKNLMTN